MSQPALTRPMAASSLLAPLLDGPVTSLHVVHRTRLALSLADTTGRVVLGVSFPGAVRLPSSCALESPADPSSSISIGDGALSWDADGTDGTDGAASPTCPSPPGRRIEYRVTRWWRPARPVPDHHTRLAKVADHDAVHVLTESWRGRLGRGPGLTPYADDVLCGALVTMSAIGHRGFGTLARAVAETDLEACTTATSASLLRAACEGWCIDELANHLGVLAGCGDTRHTRHTRRRLLAVGSSSGRGLLDGVTLVLPRPGAR